jgi:hypothetical protein
MVGGLGLLIWRGFGFGVALFFGRIISEENKFNSTEYFGSSLNSDNLNSLNIN